MRAPTSVGTDVIWVQPSRLSFVKPVRAPTSVGTDVMGLSSRLSSPSEGPMSPRLDGSGPAKSSEDVSTTAVGSCTPSPVAAQVTSRLPAWQ